MPVGLLCGHSRRLLVTALRHKMWTFATKNRFECSFNLLSVLF